MANKAPATAAVEAVVFGNEAQTKKYIDKTEIVWQTHTVETLVSGNGTQTKKYIDSTEIVWQTQHQRRPRWRR